LSISTVKTDWIKEGDLMGVIERAARDEVRRMPAEVRGSALAKAVVALARRLDGRPSDSAAALLNRELRQTFADLRAQTKGDGTGDVEEFLRRVSTPAFDAGH
jgi:hypothetical protein